MDVGTIGINANTIIWGSLTSLIGVLCIIVGYLVNNWKKSTESKMNKTDKSLEGIIRDEASCKISIGQDFVRVPACEKQVDRFEDKMAGIFKRLEELKTLSAEQHSQIMYEMGVKNGRTKS